MALPLSDRLAMLLPPPVFYRWRIARESRTGEPELAVLHKLVPSGSTAVDVGANQGFFAYALTRVAKRVIACEPNPDYAAFARFMLRGRAEVLEIALSNQPGRASFFVPFADDGTVLHLAGSLKHAHPQFRIRTLEVEVRTLDSLGLEAVRFIKADVEGSEREVLDGARLTIARDRPVILLELLAGTHADPSGETAEICRDFDYDAFIVQHGENLPAQPTIAALGKNTSWGTAIESRNVLFLPR